MAYVRTDLLNLRYPGSVYNYLHKSGALTTAPGLLDSLNDTVTQLGYVQWDDLGSGKTIDKIHLLAGTNSSAVATLTVGYQTVTNAVPHRGSGTYVRSGTVDASTLTSNTAFSTTVTGSGTVSHGDLIAVVAEFTAFTSGTLQILIADTAAMPQNPSCFINSTVIAGSPNVLLEATDGSFGTFRGGYWQSATGSTTFGQTLQHGLRFKMPFNGKVDGMTMHFRTASSGGTADVYLYTDVLGTPTAVSGFPKSFTAQHFGGTTSTLRATYLNFGEEITLTKDTNYGLVVHNTSATAINLEYAYADVGAAAQTRIYAGDGNALSLITRTGTSGAFTENTTRIPLMDIRLSSVDDGTGGSGLVVSRSIPLIV
jgi:hypothetical protein